MQAWSLECTRRPIRKLASGFARHEHDDLLKTSLHLRVIGVSASRLLEFADLFPDQLSRGHTAPDHTLSTFRFTSVVRGRAQLQVDLGPQLADGEDPERRK